MSSRYFLIGFILASLLAIYGMRQNNLTALRIRDAVISADEKNGDVESALRELREFVHAHMNTQLASGPNAIRPPIQLKYRYERLVAAEKARVSEANQKIYNEAQVICERQFPTGLSGGGRVPCIEQYVTTNGVKEKPIPDALYKFDFVSPVWSPDLAGWSWIAAGVFFILFLVRFGLERWLNHEFHAHS